MAGNNAIGTGAIILTANTDRLAAGFGKGESIAKGAAGKIDKTLAKAGKDSGGGWGKALLGGMTGGLATGALMSSFGFIKQIPQMLEGLAKKADGSQRGAINSILGGIDDLVAMGESLIMGFLEGAAPAFDQFVDTAVNLFNSALPLINTFIDGLSAYWYVLAEGFDLIVSGITEAVAWVGNLITEWTGFTFSADSGSKLVFGALRTIGKGFAYVWDTVKAGAGVVAVVVGFIVKGFGTLVEKIGEAVSKLDELAQTLPEAIRPDWIGKAGEKVKGWGNGIKEAGEGLGDWGRRQIDTWGDSAGRVDQWFDGVEARFAARKAAFNQAVAGDAMKETKLSGAFDKGGAEAYSIVTKFNTGSMIAADVNKQQLAVAKQTKDIAQKQLDVLKNSFGIEAF